MPTFGARTRASPAKSKRYGFGSRALSTGRWRGQGRCWVWPRTSAPIGGRSSEATGERITVFAPTPKLRCIGPRTEAATFAFGWGGACPGAKGGHAPSPSPIPQFRFAPHPSHPPTNAPTGARARVSSAKRKQGSPAKQLGPKPACPHTGHVRCIPARPSRPLRLRPTKPSAASPPDQAVRCIPARPSRPLRLRPTKPSAASPPDQAVRCIPAHPAVRCVSARPSRPLHPRPTKPSAASPPTQPSAASPPNQAVRSHVSENT
jgi:hypothetical protein